MRSELTLRDTAALVRLLKGSDDILLTADARGFLRDAPPPSCDLPFSGRGALLPLHLTDCFASEHGNAIRHAMGGPAGEPSDWFEVRMRDGRWYALRITVLGKRQGGGVVALLRSRSESRSLEERLFAARMTDALTGLTNRSAFMAMLDHLCARRSCGSLVLLAIDHFRAVNLRHGHSAGDRMLAVFADYLRELARCDDIVSRIGGETFAILLPDTGLHRAEPVAARIIRTLSALAPQVPCGSFPLTASAGLSDISTNSDATLASAETALFLARARGGNCLCGPQAARAA